MAGSHVARTNCQGGQPHHHGQRRVLLALGARVVVDDKAIHFRKLPHPSVCAHRHAGDDAGWSGHPARTCPPFTVAQGYNGLGGLNIVGLRRAGNNGGGTPGVEKGLPDGGVSRGQVLRLAVEESVDAVQDPGRADDARVHGGVQAGGGGASEGPRGRRGGQGNKRPLGRENRGRCGFDARLPMRCLPGYKCLVECQPGDAREPRFLLLAAALGFGPARSPRRDQFPGRTGWRGKTLPGQGKMDQFEEDDLFGHDRTLDLQPPRQSQESNGRSSPRTGRALRGKKRTRKRTGCFSTMNELNSKPSMGRRCWACRKSGRTAGKSKKLPAMEQYYNDLGKRIRRPPTGSETR